MLLSRFLSCITNLLTIHSVNHQLSSCQLKCTYLKDLCGYIPSIASANRYTLPQSLPNITDMDADQMTTTSDTQVLENGEDGVHYTPASIADINNTLDANYSIITTAMDKLTPVKVQFYFPQNSQFHPGNYQMWRQAILDCRIMYIQAGTVLLSVRAFLARTHAHAADQEWKDIEAREASQRIILCCLESDITSLDEHLAHYAFRFARLSQGPGFAQHTP